MVISISCCLCASSRNVHFLFIYPKGERGKEQKYGLPEGTLESGKERDQGKGNS